jgi:hypothetical protein
MFLEQLDCSIPPSSSFSSKQAKQDFAIAPTIHTLVSTERRRIPYSHSTPLVVRNQEHNLLPQCLGCKQNEINHSRSTRHPSNQLIFLFHHLLSHQGLRSRHLLPRKPLLAPYLHLTLVRYRNLHCNGSGSAINATVRTPLALHVAVSKTDICFAQGLQRSRTGARA